MMNNTQIFESVAARTMTPEEGAQAIQQAEKQMHERRRPGWMPIWLFVTLNVALVGFLAVFGIRQSD
jgi:predicted anti-sigma-YlaC factor YlaD